MKIKPSLVLLSLLLSSTIFLQCKKEEVVVDLQDINTDAYFEKAIRWNEQYQQWEFFNWKGTNGPNGCRIRVNVHTERNGPINITTNRTGLFELQVLSTSNVWKQVLEEHGIAGEFDFRFDSKEEPFFTGYPRLDIYYEEEVNNGNNRGLVGVIVDPATRKFKHVHMHIAEATRAPNGETRVMTEESYRSTLLHEFGHALGIYRFGFGSGHSDNENDVMYSPSKYGRLSNGDIETMVEVYSRTPFYRP